MKTSKLIRALVAGGLMGLASVSSFAAGLGRLTVQSSLGQPLQAEIELLSVQSDELGKLAARIAGQDAFQTAKIEYVSILNGVRFSVETKADGQPYLRLTTSQPINEPFVDMLVELTSASGRLVREFPLLLDPPGFSASKPSAIAKSAPISPSFASPNAQQAAPAAPSASTPATNGKTGGQYIVKSGDTLSKIAGEVKPTGVNLDQMLVALFRENKEAFVSNNMNRLKARAILRVPSAERAAGLSQTEARSEVIAQSASWNAYRNKLAGQVAADSPPANAGSQSAEGKIGKAVVESPSTAAAAPKDVLKLSKGEGKAQVAKVPAEDKANALREDATARANQMKEDKARIAQLEKNIAEMERLLSLKNQTMAQLQKQVAETAKPVQPPVPSPVEKKPAEVTPAVEAKSPSEAKPPVQAAPAEKPAQVAAVDPATASNPVPERKPAVVPKKIVPTPPPPPEPDFMEGLIQNPLYMIAGGGIAVVLFCLLSYGAYKRRKAASPTVPGATSSLATDLKSGTSPSAKASGVVDTGNSSFLTDFEKTGPGIIDTEEVDPVAEAEVYIAYGRDAQAEEILKEAMAKDASRHEIPLKLLEIYSARKSAASFEAIAKELHRSGGPGHPIWNRVAEMGRKLDPSNGLYTVGAAAVVAAAPTVPQITRVAAVDEVKTIPLHQDAAPTIEEMAAHGQDLDFDLDLDLPTTDEPATVDVTSQSGDVPVDLPLIQEEPHIPEPVVSTTENQALDFDLGGIELPKPVADRPEPPAADQTMLARPKFAAQFADDDLDLSDFGAIGNPAVAPVPSVEVSVPVEVVPAATPLPDLELDMGAPIIPTAVDTASKRPVTPSLDLGGLNFDLSPVSLATTEASSEANGDSEWHSVATKLDLARAYLEIGDREGAREILQEVMHEGDAEQKREAEVLTAGIG